MKPVRTLSYILVLVGVALLVIGFANPKIPGLVTAMVDNTPPVFGGTYPSDGGGYANLTSVRAVVSDLESGVVSVNATIDGQLYILSQSLSSTWQLYGLSITTAGSHTFSFTASNTLGLVTSVSGSFTLGALPSLTGNWYVNSILITSPNQIVTSTSLQLTFRFNKTSAAVPDSSISCSIILGSTSLVTLVNSGSGVWTGSYTFPTGGTYVLSLQASSGGSPVTMSFTMDTGSRVFTLSDTQLGFLGGGAVSLGAGFALMYNTKPRRVRKRKH